MKCVGFGTAESTFFEVYYLFTPLFLTLVTYDKDLRAAN